MKPIQAVSLWNKSFAVCNENRGDAAGLRAQWGQEWMSELLDWFAAYGPRLPQVLCVCLLRVLAGSSGGASSTALPFPGRPGAVCVSSAGGKWGRRKGHRRQTPLEVQCPVLLFSSLVPAVGAGAFYPSLAKKKIAVLAQVPVLMHLYHLQRTLLARFALSGASLRSPAEGRCDELRFRMGVCWEMLPVTGEGGDDWKGRISFLQH